MLQNRGIALIVLGIAGAGLLLAADSPPAPRQTPPTTKPATQPAKELTLDLGDKVTMKLVLIPAGKFLMGSPETEYAHYKDEIQHEVTISKPFYMGVTTITVDQFATFAKETGYKTTAETKGFSIGHAIRDGQLKIVDVRGASWRNPGFDQKGDHPVVHVSWNDAQAFCAWLSQKSGQTAALPTEAQWEYACRAGAKTAYPWGDNPDDGKGWANLADQSLRKLSPDGPSGWPFFKWDDGFVYTSPVGSFKANTFGLYDMIGNVAQWCDDWSNPYDDGPVTDPTGSHKGLRAMRGSSWAGATHSSRSAVRGGSADDSRFDRTGFRVLVPAARVE